MKLIHRSLVAIIALEVHSILAQAPHNLTTIVGTWSSGAGAVLTGAVSFFVAFDEEAFLMKPFVLEGFANPANLTFSPPKVLQIFFGICRMCAFC